ncbi:hypothetical protein SCA6_018339 [Theobroma cacao]
MMIFDSLIVLSNDLILDNVSNSHKIVKDTNEKNGVLVYLDWDASTSFSVPNLLGQLVWVTVYSTI